MYILVQKRVKIKYNLTTEDEACHGVDLFNPNFDQHLKLTKQEFEKMAIPLLIQIQEVLIQTFSKAEIFATDINKVLLVGGGCRMPMIQHFLRKRFTFADHTCVKNSVEMVAIASTYYASFFNV